MATEVSFLLTVIALLPKVLITSAITFLCLWVGKRCFIFLRGFYIVSGGQILRIKREGDGWEGDGWEGMGGDDAGWLYNFMLSD